MFIGVIKFGALKNPNPNFFGIGKGIFLLILIWGGERHEFMCILGKGLTLGVKYTVLGEKLILGGKMQTRICRGWSARVYVLGYWGKLILGGQNAQSNFYGVKCTRFWWIWRLGGKVDLFCKKKWWNYPCLQWCFGRKRNWGQSANEHIFSRDKCFIRVFRGALIFWGEV